MNKACLLDTNVLVRFFTGQPPDMAERARALIAQADTGKLRLLVPSLIVAEAIYTLESFYEMPKVDVCERLLALLRSRGIAPLEPVLIQDALERYQSLPVHFADAYLAATAAASGTPVFSFDEDFARFKDIVWKR